MLESILQGLREVEGVPYIRFLVPGLVMLGVINNSFLNTSSSLFILKLQGTIVDLLVTPLSYLEILAAFLAFIPVADCQFVQLFARDFTVLWRQHAHQIAAVNVVLKLVEFFVGSARWPKKVPDDHVGQLIADRGRRGRWGVPHGPSP